MSTVFGSFTELLCFDCEVDDTHRQKYRQEERHHCRNECQPSPGFKMLASKIGFFFSIEEKFTKELKNNDENPRVHVSIFLCFNSKPWGYPMVSIKCPSQQMAVGVILNSKDLLGSFEHAGKRFYNGIFTTVE